MKENKTITVRISDFFHRIFTEKAKKDGVNFAKKIDEIYDSLKYIYEDEVELGESFMNLYKNDEKNRPKFMYDVMYGLTNYYGDLNLNKFDENGFLQYIDRYNILANYIAAHVYTNVLGKSSLTSDEINKRAVTKLGVIVFFIENHEEIIIMLNEMMKKFDPYKSSFYTKELKANIISEIFDNKELMELVENSQASRVEKDLVLLYKDIQKKAKFKNDKCTSIDISVKSYGLYNKINRIIYNGEKIDKLPYFVDEKFVFDMLLLMHKAYSMNIYNDLYNTKPIISAYRILKTIKMLNRHNLDHEQYYKSNFQTSNEYNKLSEVIDADIKILESKEYTYSPEMRARTPYQLMEELIKNKIRFVNIPDINKVIIENIYNLVLPIYNMIVINDNMGIKSKIEKDTKSFYSNNKNAQIEICMKDSFYYTELILYSNDFVYTFNFNFQSIEKIYYLLKSKENNSNTRLEKRFTIYKADKDIKLVHKNSAITLSGELKEEFEEVIKKTVETEIFKEFKNIHIINNGLE